MIAVGPWLDPARVREPILRSPHRPHTCWFGHMRGLVQGDVHCRECRRRPLECRDVQLLVSDIERLLLGRLSVFLGHVALLPRAASSKGTARRQRSRSQMRGRREREACQRAMAGNARRQRRHSRQSWQCSFCKLQIPNGLAEFESHPLRHPSLAFSELRLGRRVIARRRMAHWQDEILP